MAVLLLASYVISLITVVMSLVLKVPQILDIYKTKRVSAISLYSLFLELTSYTVMTCYNYTNGYSLLTYLEYPIILAQEFVLIYLVLLYKQILSSDTVKWAALYFLITAAFLLKILPPILLTLLAPICTPISASSKVIQLRAIISAGSSDGISMTTWFISAMTNLSRAFTVYVDSADRIILSNMLLSALLSSSIMAATHYYRPRRYVYPKKTQLAQPAEPAQKDDIKKE